jgi:PrtD family type I secretion system ABC transporter
MNSILLSIRPALAALVLFGFATNLAVLVSPLFMMQVLDRVIPSGILNTLFLLGLLALGALVINAIIEYFRDQSLGRIALWIEEAGTDFMLSRPTDDRPTGFRQVETVSGFFAGKGITACLDLPWIMLFVTALFLIHPAFLLVLLLAVSSFLVLSFGKDILTKQSCASQGQSHAAMKQTLKDIDGQAMLGEIMSIQSNLGQRYLNATRQRANAANKCLRSDTAIEATTQGVRSIFQIATLGLGAALVTQNQLTAGGMIGASIILAKTLGSLEAAIGLRTQVSTVREAWIYLSKAPPQQIGSQTSVHDLSGALKANNLTYPRGGGLAPRLGQISFYLEPGTFLAILGESGSGKSSLLNALSGVDPAPIGNCFYDETDVRSIDQSAQPDIIGYVPQSANFASGTIANYIARFDSHIDDEKVIAAAKLAGVHGVISALPSAYQTDLSAEPYAVSAGQKQRIAFARAIYHQPRYLFLDEPNALLDHNSERALGDALVRLKALGVTIVLTAHRMSIVNLADQVAVMERGRIIDYGPRAKILGRMTDGHRRIRLGVADGAIQDLHDYVARQFVRDGDGDFRQRAIRVSQELYRFAVANGPKTLDRSLHFVFSFVDDDTCAITVSEYRSTKLEAKIRKVREATNGSVEITEVLSEDELSLATVMELSESVQHKSDQGESALCARITHHLENKVPLQ